MDATSLLALALLLTFAVLALELLWWWALLLLIWGPAAYAGIVAGYLAAAASGSLLIGVATAAITAGIVRRFIAVLLAQFERCALRLL